MYFQIHTGAQYVSHLGTDSCSVGVRFDVGFSVRQNSGHNRHDTVSGYILRSLSALTAFENRSPDRMLLVSFVEAFTRNTSYFRKSLCRRFDACTNALIFSSSARQLSTIYACETEAASHSQCHLDSDTMVSKSSTRHFELLQHR